MECKDKDIKVNIYMYTTFPKCPLKFYHKTGELQKAVTTQLVGAYHFHLPFTFERKW